MNFKEYFLLNEAYAGSRSKPINKETFEILYKTHCKEYNPRGMPLYRSVKEINGECYLTDPRFTERYATDTNSYVMWFLESLPEWQKYPPRSKSIITASDHGNSSGYHGSRNVYKVIPFDNTNLGICKNSDFWGAFEKLDVTVVNNTIQYLIDLFYTGNKQPLMSSYTGASKNVLNRKQFLSFINSIDFKLFDNPENKQEYSTRLGDPRYGSKIQNSLFHPLETKDKSNIASFYSANEKEQWQNQREETFRAKDAFSILKNLKKAADPEQNGFQHMQHQTYNGLNRTSSPFMAFGKHDREIWFSNRALLLSEYDDEYPDDRETTIKYLESI